MFNKKELEYIRKAVAPYTEVEKEYSDIVNKIDETLSELESVTQNLYSLYWDYGRSGSVEGLFKATQDEVDRAIGCEVYFGEILGKHSEVYGDLKAGQITLESDNPLVVINAVESGYNPLEYITSSHYYTLGLNSAQLRELSSCWDLDVDEEEIEDMSEDNLVDYFNDLISEEISCPEELREARDSLK